MTINSKAIGNLRTEFHCRGRSQWHGRGRRGSEHRVHCPLMDGEYEICRNRYQFSLGASLAPAYNMILAIFITSSNYKYTLGPPHLRADNITRVVFVAAAFHDWPGLAFIQARLYDVQRVGRYLDRYHRYITGDSIPSSNRGETVTTVAEIVVCRMTFDRNLHLVPKNDSENDQL